MGESSPGGGWDRGLRLLENKIVLLLIVDSKIVDRELVDTHVGFNKCKMMNFQRIQFSWEERLECSLSPVRCGSYQCLNGNKIRHLMRLQAEPQALLLGSPVGAGTCMGACAWQ